MVIFFGETVTVQVQGQAWRAATCEHCGRPFNYQVLFTAAAGALNPYFLDSFGTRERAETDARARLDEALRRDVFPVPCPHSTLYQSDMVPAVRAEQFPGMRWAGRALLALTPTALVLTCLITGMLGGAGDRDGFPPTALAAVFGLPALLLSAGVGLLLARRYRQAAYDPNAEEHAEARRRAAAAFARTPEEFARLRVPPPPDVLGSPPPRWAQPVGQNCVRCGQRIPSELDSRYCRGCGWPVHDRCAVPAEGGGCPVCGAGLPAT